MAEKGEGQLESVNHLRVPAVRNPWLAYTRASAQAHVRLFCFPYAGGSAAIYRRWVTDAPPEVDVCPVQLPGREGRLLETPITSMDVLVEAVAQGLEDELAQPFALFGHSMGAILAYELSRLLRRRGAGRPLHVFVSGCSAPDIGITRIPIHALPRDKFTEELKRLNGTPEAVLQNAELMQLMEPVLRADFTAIERYVHRPGAPLDCPVTAFHGSEDPDVRMEHVERWRAHTTAQFERRSFAGDHFFIHRHGDVMLKQVCCRLGWCGP